MNSGERGGGWIKDKAAHAIEAAPQPTAKRHASAEEPVMVRIGRREQEAGERSGGRCDEWH